MHAFKGNFNFTFTFYALSTPNIKNQLWVGAGIGIVPFIAWLNHLVRKTHSNNQHIELFYCRDNDDQHYFAAMLETLVKKLPFVHLHVYTASQNEFLSATDMAQYADLSIANASFCGPLNFGVQLKKDLIQMGLQKEKFHSERFVMR